MLSELVTLTFAYFSLSFFLHPSSVQTLLQKPISHETFDVSQATPSKTPANAPTPIASLTPTTIPTNTPTLTIIEPTATPTPQPTSTQAISVPVDLESLFQRFSEEYHVDKEVLKRIANCESSFNTQATNGDYAGMYQFVSQSWITVRSEMGADTNPDLRTNAQESIKTAAFMIEKERQNAWPSC